MEASHFCPVRQLVAGDAEKTIPEYVASHPGLRIALLGIRVLAATGPGLRSLPSLAAPIVAATGADGR